MVLRFVGTFVLVIMMAYPAVANNKRPFSAEGEQLRKPIYDANNRLTHIIYAEQARYEHGKLRLLGVRIELVDGTQKPPVVTATLATTRALYSSKTATVQGNRMVHFNTTDCTATGTGFLADLNSQLITIHGRCRVQRAGLRAEADEVVLKFRELDERQELERMNATGNVVVHNLGTQQYDFDEARTTSATFEVDSGHVTMPTQVRVLSNQTWMTSNKLLVKTKLD